MEPFNPKPTKIAEWQELVTEAEGFAGYNFDENLEHYLIITLDHFTREENWSHSIIAIEYLNALQVGKELSAQQLRGVGDQCLLLTGLFPEQALNKNVSLNYFINLGQQAYAFISTKEKLATLDPKLFNQLSHHFIGLTDILQTMRFLHS